MIGSIVYGNTIWPHWVLLLFSAMLYFAAQEMVAITLKTGSGLNNLLAALYVALFWWSSMIMPVSLIQLQALAGLVVWLLIALALPWYRHSGHWSLLIRILLLGMGLDLLWISAHALVYLHSLTEYGVLLLYLFSLVWIADIGAYFSGKRFGKNKLAPAISPGKTREGVLGGLGLNLLWIGIVFAISDGWGLGPVAFFVLSLITALLSIVGDLFISVLKREAGVKDSGKLLPGHGGMLDRIDSVTAAAPVFVGGMYLAGLS